MLTVKQSSNLYPFITWIDELVDVARYWTWRDGIIPNGWGAYAINKPLRPELYDIIRTRGLFCAAVPNLARRRAGKEIPHKGNALFDGGIAAYTNGTFGPGYFSSREQPFNSEIAMRWARETRSGVLLIKGYWGPEIHLQGHVGILLPSGYILQSVSGEGLHWGRTINHELDYWNKFGRMVHPDRWIEGNADRADWAR